MEEVATTAYRSGVVIEPGGGVDGLEPSQTLVALDAAGERIGIGGKVSEDVIDTPVWAGDTFALEVRLPDVVPAKPVVTYERTPQLPASERDLALLVPDSVSAAAVEAVIRGSAGEELEDLEIFDLYRGEGVPDGVRSIAYRLRFRSPRRTLKDKHVEKALRTVLRRLEEELGVQSRG